MTGRKLHLTWVDASGDPYHSDSVRPCVARDLLGKLRGQLANNLPLRRLTYAAVSRSTRAWVFKLNNGHECIITVAEDAL